MPGLAPEHRLGLGQDLVQLLVERAEGFLHTFPQRQISGPPDLAGADARFQRGHEDTEYRRGAVGIHPCIQCATVELLQPGLQRIQFKLIALLKCASLGRCIKPVFKLVLADDAQLIGFGLRLGRQLSGFELSDHGQDALLECVPDLRKIDLEFACRLQ